MSALFSSAEFTPYYAAFITPLSRRRRHSHTSYHQSFSAEPHFLFIIFQRPPSRQRPPPRHQPTPQRRRRHACAAHVVDAAATMPDAATLILLSLLMLFRLFSMPMPLFITRCRLRRHFFRQMLIAGFSLLMAIFAFIITDALSLFIIDDITLLRYFR